METSKELSSDAAKIDLKLFSRYLRGAPGGTYMVTLRLGQDSALTTDSSGILQTVISNVPTSAQNWSSYASVFDEYRVLGLCVAFEPLWSTGGSTATYWAPIAHVVDRSDSTALTGYGLAERYDSHRKTRGQKSFKHIALMSSIEEASFLSTSSSTALYWIKFYSSGNSLSLTVGRLNIQFVVQFRGLGIN